MKKNKDISKFKESFDLLEKALHLSKKALKDPLAYAAIAKSFEVCLEYAWKDLKRNLEKEGFDPTSPREVIKLAGKVGWIDSVEAWLDFLENRNLAVHDYLGLTKKQYLSSVHSFFEAARKLLK